MKKQLTRLIVGIAVLAIGGAVQAATWNGVTANWNTDNWGLDGPDGCPGDSNYTNEDAIINSGVVTLQSTTSLNTIGKIVVKGTLNLDANLTTTVAYSYLGSWSDFTVNHYAGTLTLVTRADIGDGGSDGTNYIGTYNLNGGTLDVNGNDFRLGYVGTGSANRATLNVNGGALDADNNVTVRQGTLHVTDGSVNVSGTYNMDANDGATPEIHIDGAEATSVSFGALDAFNASGQTTIRFTLDSSGQVTVITAGTLNINGTVNADLIVDATALSPNTHLGDLVLFDYGTLNGAAFNSISVLSGSEVTYTPSYLHDIDGEGDLGIALEGFYIIPEPATGLLVLLGALMFLHRRRRA